jgi:hypothetical protein
MLETNVSSECHDSASALVFMDENVPPVPVTTPAERRYDRAHRQETDLEDVVSAIGAEGLAVPMAVADLLTGALICLPHAGEQFAPNVRAALAEAARNLGTSLYVLRYREQARLVADIAGRRIDETAARTRAVALMEGGI